MADFTAADGFGVVGAFLLLVAPARDQILRAKVAILERLRHRGSRSPGLKELLRIAAEARENERNRWHMLDTAATALGAICLGASYLTT